MENCWHRWRSMIPPGWADVWHSDARCGCISTLLSLKYFTLKSNKFVVAQLFYVHTSICHSVTCFTCCSTSLPWWHNKRQAASGVLKTSPLSHQAILLSSDGYNLVTGGDNGVVEVWQACDFKQLYIYPGCDAGIRAMDLSHDQRLE